MALATTELVVAYSAIETVIIRQMFRALAFAARDHEAELQNAYSVKIPKRNHTVAATAYSRGGDWKALQETDISLQDMTMNLAAEVGNRIRREDVIESPLNLVVTTAEEQGEAMAKKMNRDVYDAMMNVDTGANGTLSGALSGTKGASNAAWVDDTGAIQKSGSGSLADDFMLTNLKAFRNAFINANMMFTGRIDYAPTVVMNPPLYYNLADYVLDEKLGDALNFEILRESTVANPMPGFVARIMRMNIFIDPDVHTLITANTNKDDSANQHAMLGIAPMTRALQFATRPPAAQFLTPTTNQTGPFYAIRSVRDYAIGIEARNLLFKHSVRRTKNG